MKQRGWGINIIFISNLQEIHVVYHKLFRIQ